MLQVMIKTALFHLGTQTDVAILAHYSWAPFRSSMNISHLILLDDKTFFDMRSTWVGAQRPLLASQSSANKLRIFQLMPAARNYDIVIMLDTDIVVQANFLLLIGHICSDTLYTVAHRTLPERKRTVVWFQSRNFNPAEISHMRAKGLHLFNAGQLVFRPSAHMEDLFHKAYHSYKLNPRASLYEQGHLNTVFLLEGNVQYTLTHLTLLGFAAAMAAAPPTAYALIHVCDTTQPSSKKLAAMRRHLGKALHPQQTIQNFLPRLWRCLDTSLECGYYEERLRRAGENGRGKGKGTMGAQRSKKKMDSEVDNGGGSTRLRNETLEEASPSAALRIEDSPDLIASYMRFVTQPNVSHMCEAGFHRGRTAAVALFANPSAKLVVFSPAGLPWSVVAMRNLRDLFPSRVIHLPGELGLHMSTGRRLPCSTFLLPPEDPDGAVWRALPALRATMAPPGHLFAAWSARWQSAVAAGLIAQGACREVVAGRRRGRWCSGRLRPP
eukprot:EG_transcript_6623